MRPQQVGLVSAIFFGGMMLACIASGTWLLNGETNIINALASFNTMEIATGGGWGLPKATLDFFDAVVTALGWNYPFLVSPWTLPLKMILWVVSIMTVFGLIQTAIQAVNGLVGAARSLITPGV